MGQELVQELREVGKISLNLPFELYTQKVRGMRIHSQRGRMIPEDKEPLLQWNSLHYLPLKLEQDGER
jgi:hypothetical protein